MGERVGGPAVSDLRSITIRVGYQAADSGQAEERHRPVATMGGKRTQPFTAGGSPPTTPASRQVQAGEGGESQDYAWHRERAAAPVANGPAPR